MVRERVLMQFTQARIRFPSKMAGDTSYLSDPQISHRPFKYPRPASSQIFPKSYIILGEDKMFRKLRGGDGMMKKLSQREMKRLMKKAGISMESLEGVERVEIHKGDGGVIVIKNPLVTRMQVSGQTTFQVIGEKITMEEERGGEGEEGRAEVKIPEEDILLVAQQAGVDREAAKRALEMTGGDLAQAILLLKGR
jgi:nascent polypeptide-associated complex subunit alpha